MFCLLIAQTAQTAYIQHSTCSILLHVQCTMYSVQCTLYMCKVEYIRPFIPTHTLTHLHSTHNVFLDIMLNVVLVWRNDLGFQQLRCLAGWLAGVTKYK